MIPKRNSHKEDNTDSWLMSYADMITLLMCFFIIFVAASEPKKEKMKEITDGIAKKFGMVDLSTPLAGLYQSLEAIGEVHHVMKHFAVSKKENSVEMELASAVFFKADSAQIDDDQLDTLTALATEIKKASFLDYRIIVEGHTSDAPVKSGLYPSNWELSGAQAAAIVRFFIDQGISPEHLKAEAYADTKPIVPNRDGNNNVILPNRAQNERIVIRLERVL